MLRAHEGRNLLLIGHPGHELRVFGWVGRTSPLVCILTDGSGGGGSPRLSESLALLKAEGAEIGPICGEFSDRQIYADMLSHNYGVFEDICLRLAEMIASRDVEAVISDAVEGYNPTHDLCEALARTAVALAGTRHAKTVRHYTFPLMGDPRPPAECRRSDYLEVDLSPAQFCAKLQITRQYAHTAGATLEREVEDTLRQFGEPAFAREYLFAALPPHDRQDHIFETRKPYYETYGEGQVAAGRYVSVLRFREHILPLIGQLDAMASAACRAKD